MGAGNHPTSRKGREQGPWRRERGHHGGHQNPHARRAYHGGGTSAPQPQRTPHDPRGRTPPTHAAEVRNRRNTEHTGTRPPATGNHTADGGHTCKGRTGYTHRRSHWEHRRAAHHHALTARRRPRPPQGPPHKHQKRTKARPQHPGLGTGTLRGHGTTTQAPRKGNPTDTYPTHQPERHTKTPTTGTQRHSHT